MIRPALLSDIPALLDLGEAMHAESRYAKFVYDRAQFERTLMATVDNGVSQVCEMENGIVGGLIAFVSPQFFGPDLMSADLGLYITPEFRRGALASRLIQAYIQGAMAHGVTDIRIGCSTGMNLDALYEANGFRRVGGLFALEV